MQFKKVLPYNIKRRVRRAVLATSLAGATLVGCNKEPMHDVELKFESTNDTAITLDNIKKHVRDKSVRHIYMVPINGGGYYWDDPNDLTDLCDYLEKCVQLDPNRVSGKEDLGFLPGVITLADSLRFLQMGFTVNQQKYRY